MSGDWLDTSGKDSTPLVPAAVTVPDDYAARLTLAETCWARLSEKQKLFLNAWRDCRYNARAACRQLGLSENTKPHTAWMHESNYATVVRVWRANAAANALDRDRLLARQDDIVETLLTPKPVLHQGVPVLDTRPGATPGAVLEEVEAGAASRANETLMNAAGLWKDKEVEVNVGVVIGPPTLDIRVMPPRQVKAEQREHVVIDAQFTEVPTDDWMDA